MFIMRRWNAVPENEWNFLPWLAEMGVRSATTCERGLARASDKDLLLPRFLDDSSVDLLRFQSFVAGVFA